MKLLTLQIFSRGKDGLHSELLSFGNHITQLYGPNGSGKTPTVQSIAYCLGYKSIFRDDIYSRCEYVRLTFEINGVTYISSRTFSREFDLTLEVDGRIQNFHNEREFSEFLFGNLELDADRKLVGLNNMAAEPYVSTLLPLYYLDQDNGYNSFYAPPDTFIKDQQSEMMRISFRLPAKHSFEQKKDSIELKKKIDALDALTNERERQLSSARAQLNADGESSDALHVELESLQTQLDGFKASSMTQSESVQAMQQLIKTNLRSVLSIDSELREIELRLAGKRNIIAEINSEINTLSLNEDARRIFMSFEEICSAPQCGMFLKSSNSYGKNLLYLKDQIKDLDRNSELEDAQKSRLLDQRKKLSLEIADLEQSQAVASTKTESAALVDAISAIKNRVFAIQLKLADKRKIEILETRFREAYSQRETALNAYQELGSETSFSPQLTLVRSEFRKLFIRWLDILNTPNVNFDITFKQDFIPIFGSETVNQLKGSTKLRTVLAYHAAFIEQMAKIGGSLKIFILDTPKQHDIHNDDLNNYFLALKSMSKENGVQVIFSSTEYHYVGDGDDAEWNPSFPGKLHSMFYGTRAT